MKFLKYTLYTIAAIAFLAMLGEGETPLYNVAAFGVFAVCLFTAKKIKS